MIDHASVDSSLQQIALANQWPVSDMEQRSKRPASRFYPLLSPTSWDVTGAQKTEKEY